MFSLAIQWWTITLGKSMVESWRALDDVQYLYFKQNFCTCSKKLFLFYYFLTFCFNKKASRPKISNLMIPASIFPVSASAFTTRKFNSKWVSFEGCIESPLVILVRTGSIAVLAKCINWEAKRLLSPLRIGIATTQISVNLNIYNSLKLNEVVFVQLWLCFQIGISSQN